MENKEKLLKAMKDSGKALKAGEAGELAGLSKTDTDKAIKELKKEELIVSPKRCYWEPK